jgi:hypothetical protein
VIFYWPEGKFVRQEPDVRRPAKSFECCWSHLNANFVFQLDEVGAAVDDELSQDRRALQVFFDEVKNLKSDTLILCQAKQHAYFALDQHTPVVDAGAEVSS